MSPRRRKLRLAIVPVGVNEDFIQRLYELEAFDGVSFSMESILKTDKTSVQTKLLILCGGGDDDDVPQYDAVLTFGGIGCGRNDVVPEATADVVQRSLPALSHSFHQRCDLASLRPVFGMRNEVVVANLPSPEDLVTMGNGDAEETLILDLAKRVVKSIKRIFETFHHYDVSKVRRKRSKRKLEVREERREAQSVQSLTDRRLEAKEKESKREITHLQHPEVIPFKSEPVSDDDDTIIFDNDAGEDDDRDLSYSIDRATVVVASTIDHLEFDRSCDDAEDADVGAETNQDDGLRLSTDSETLKDSYPDSQTEKGKNGATRPAPTLGPLFVNVGNPLFDFFKAHPLTKGIVLNRNKRHIKRDLALVKPRKSHEDASASTFSVTMENWTRNGRIMKKNWLDDEFELTRSGQQQLQRLLESPDDSGGGGVVAAAAAAAVAANGRKKDTSVCTWYLSCPGTSACRRECGGIGECLPGCKGKTSKQDRHNCQLMVKMQIFLLDVTKWVVSFHGRHNWSNSLPASPSSTDRRLFGDEEKRVLNSLIANEKITCRDELLRRLKRHYRENDVQISATQTQKLSCFLDRYLTKRFRSASSVS